MIFDAGSVAAWAENLHQEEQTIQDSVLLEKLDDIVEREPIARINQV
ncbi:hypothetical protein [Bradyrhizobium retamae]|nr:hypothetical protein [Bradyrhizobium retamae]